jgi:hypothetical protein
MTSPLFIHIKYFKLPPKIERKNAAIRSNYAPYVKSKDHIQ